MSDTDKVSPHPRQSTYSGVESLQGESPQRPAVLNVLSESAPARDEHQYPPRDLRFKLVVVALCFGSALTALELSAVSTALPIIVNDLGGNTFIWVGSAFALGASACIPLSGGIAQAFGRRVTILGSLAIMMIGSALCGAAQSMTWLIATRAVQGVGGGGVAALCYILISDLVPLKDRGSLNGIVAIAWVTASGSGPVIGGVLAQKGQWRWIFYLNLPIGAVAGILFLTCLRLPTPPGTVREKLARLDWFGNALIIASTTSTIIALTWGGVTYPWQSWHVLTPLICGVVGIFLFLAYEGTIAKYPVVPFRLMTSRTGLSGYVQNFTWPLVMLGIVYYIPVYFQACKNATPIRSGLYQLGCSLVTAPAGMGAGIWVKKSGRYRAPLWIGWCFVIAGTAALTTIHADTPTANAVAFIGLAGIGVGMMSTTVQFPILAPLPISQGVAALAFYTFLRNFAQVWGVAISGAVLQNELSKRTPESVLNLLTTAGNGASAIAYEIIPVISRFPDDVQSQIRVAFAESLRIVWFVLLGISVFGLIVSLPMRRISLATDDVAETDSIPLSEKA